MRIANMEQLTRKLRLATAYAASVPFFDELVSGLDGPMIRDGYVTVPDAPGLGVDLDLDACRRYARRDEPFFE